MKGKSQEKYLRKKAKSFGLRLIKSRSRKINADNLGGYMIIDIKNNALVDGQRFDLSLKDVKKWINLFESFELIADEIYGAEEING